MLIVGTLTCIYPLRVDVNWLREIVDSRLKVLQTDATHYVSGISLSIQFHLTALLVIAEGTVEESIQRLDGLSPLRSLTLTLLASHLDF